MQYGNVPDYSRFMYLKGFTPEQIYASFRQTQRKKHKKKREQSIMEKEVFNFMESMAEAAINEAVAQLLKDWK